MTVASIELFHVLDKYEPGRNRKLDRWTVFAKSGALVVGKAVLVAEGKTKLYPMSIEVLDSFRRQGVATAMYKYGQKVSGRKMRPSGQQTDAAKALWKTIRREKSLGTFSGLLNGSAH